MRDLFEDLRERIEALRSDGLYRELAPPRGVDFSSNDYLGLSNHPKLRERLREAVAEGPVGAPASRLLRGHTEEHARLEARLARWKGSESALLFPSGYQSNAALLSTLVKKDDLAISDEANHASIVDGLRASGCRAERFRHLDVGAVEEILRRRPARGRVFIVTESLFSMDGDIAPLELYAALAEERGAHLIVDDAHATGIYGPARGSGLVEESGVESRVAASVSTCGKALGLSGAFVAGPNVLKEYLVNRARPFIFSTATPPVLVRAIAIALDILEEEPWRRRRALELAARLRSALRAGGAEGPLGTGTIVPVVLGSPSRALEAARRISQAGFDVRAVRPPAVPPGTARLRISVHADRSEEEVDRLAAATLAALSAAAPERSGVERP
ncbi:MAG: aminotransferase class I/II-fold pyridoxal phosphate-dependent enzyme [Planctomycetota bacterium]